MPDAARKIRLFCAAGLCAGGTVELAAEQAHYLRNVMRCRSGEEIALFNPGDGEWRARIEALAKGATRLRLIGQVRSGGPEPGPWLVFAAVKRGPLDLLIEKATELGAERLQPLLSRRTVVGRVKPQRLAAIAREATEQCGRLSLPELCPPIALDGLLEAWPKDRTLLHCDEAGEAASLASALAGLRAAKCGVLVGPEGGFDAAERALLRRQGFVRPVALGPRILRAETAGIAALAVLQALAGDWEPRPRRPADETPGG